MSDKPMHGYNYSFAKPPSNELICKICELPCRNSHTSMCCANLFCQYHIFKNELEKDVKTCPMCKSEKFSSIPNPLADEMIDELLVHCPNKDTGCAWVGKLREANEHCNNDMGCQHQILPCTYKCGRLLKRCNLDEHLQTDCPCYCQYCNTVANKETILKKHKENCLKFPVTCPNHCGTDVLRDGINEHIKLCPLEKIQCEYHEIGCKTMILRKDVKNHNINEINKHLHLVKNTQNSKNRGSLILYCFLFLLTCYCFYSFSVQEQHMNNQFQDLNKKYEMLQERWTEGRKKDLLLMQDKMNNIRQNTPIIFYEVERKSLYTQVWGIRMDFDCMMALHGNQVTPVLIKIHNFDNWRMHEESWKSAPFYDVQDGNKFFVSAKPADNNIIISLHTMPPIVNKDLKGTFTIEVLNQLNNTDHLLAGSLEFNNNKSSSIVKKYPDVYILGDVKYNEIEKVSLDENIVYLLGNVLYLKISYFHSTR